MFCCYCRNVTQIIVPDLVNGKQMHKKEFIFFTCHYSLSSLKIIITYHYDLGHNAPPIYSISCRGKI
jgi:hypothetical protein